MLKYLNGNKKNFIQDLKSKLENRRNIKDSDILLVKKIIKDVKKNKDKSIIKYEKKYTKLKNVNIKSIKFTEKEIKNIIKKLNKKVKTSIDLAYKRIINFHKKQKFKSFKIIDKYRNRLSYVSTPIETIGVYVPGGNASYPSSVLMNCIPAKLAGVKNIYMTTPCLNGLYNPAILYAAKKCNIKEIYKVGGAQSIAALTFGTKTVKKVDKIVGPGNKYVALAKKEVFGNVGIDMIAGPSEVTVVADKSIDPSWIAADLIAQSEHDINSQSIVIINNKSMIKEINLQLNLQLKNLKNNLAKLSLKNYGYLIYCTNKKNLIKIINEIAPEHLELCVKKPEKILKQISNAGSVFLGKYSPEAMGDYLAGPNHVLPTSGSAKFSSGLSVYDFIKRRSVIRISKLGIERLGPSVINLAKHEKLEGHASSIKIRLK